MKNFVRQYTEDNTAFKGEVTDNRSRLLEIVADTYRKSIERQFYQAVSDDVSPILRASNLGKPAIELFAKKWHPEWFEQKSQSAPLSSSVLEDDEELPETVLDTGNTYRLTQLFHCGDVFEADFIILCDLFGWEILESQTEMNLYPITGLHITGHLDFVVRCPDTKQVYIIDTKTCSDRSWTQMQKGMYTERREYVTQIALYHEWLTQNRSYGSLIPGWILYNKNNSNIAWLECSEEDRLNGLEVADSFAEAWRYLDGATWDAVREVVSPPAPVEEVFRRSKTGCYLLPPSMRYSPIAEHVYDIVVENNGYGKPTKYVRDTSEWFA